MLRFVLFTILAVVFTFTQSFGQKIGKKKPPQVSLTKYNAFINDGELEVDLFVRMADCISHIELVDPDYDEKIILKVKLEDYYIKSEKTNAIYVKIRLGRLKEILRKRSEAYPEMIVYSKTGKSVYSAPLAINRSELINTRLDN